ncbi:hypothetical protein [Lysinibacillus piscis]|nr:hypothetical protein [Lysinibacillus sp. KH24]
MILPMFQSNERVSQVTNEEKLAQVLQAIQGVGEVKVYFYYGDLEVAQDDNKLFSQYFRGTDQQKTTVTGILVVAQGASDIFMKNEIRTVISQMMQLPIHRIVIVPMENKEEQ